MRGICVVPEPKFLESTDRSFAFNGFENFPEFLTVEFNLPKGDWKIVKARREGTGLEVKDKEIVIWGEEPIACATILQLVKQSKGYLPEVRITESLRFEFRGYSLDIARGAVPRIETFRKILRWLFLLKYNYFAIYFEDLFPWKKYPQIGEHRGRLSEDELREVIEYGNSMGIEVFPSLELSGHMQHILSLRDVRSRGFSEWRRLSEGCLDLSNEKAREFAYDLLREVVDFFPSRYVHIGGDETWALGRGKSLDKIWRFEGPRLYELHHKNMIEIVKKSGKEPIMWGDMISGSIGLGKTVSRAFGMKWAELTESNTWKEVLVANWIYAGSPEHYRDRIRMLKDLGIEQIACPSLRSADRFYPFFRRALRNVQDYLAVAREEGLWGFLVTAWGDQGWECLFSFLDPLILATMEFAEGNGRWEEKWMALSGENEDVLKARMLLGTLDFVLGHDMLKHVIFRDFFFYRKIEKEPGKKDELKSLWKKMLKDVENTILPEDLSFIRSLLEVGFKVLEDDVKASDYLMLSNVYSRLWLRERRPEGLDRIVEEFWGAAGREDMKLGIASRSRASHI